VRELGGVPRVFSEYAGAGTLDDWIRSEHLYKGEQKEVLLRILDIAIQFAWGLHYAHEYKHNNENKGIVHQDVKPLNLLVMKDEPMPTVKVTDFGLVRARALPEGELSAGKDRNEQGTIIVAQSGGMTLAYCSPEQAAGQPLTRRTDVWSWGLSVLTMFTGEVTWAQENVATGPLALQILEQFLEHNGEEKKIPVMPKGVAELLRQCFNKNPDDRPHSMQDCAAALIEIYQSENDGKPYPRIEPKAAELKASALNNRGVSYFDLGKEEEARKCWEEAIKEDLQHLEATANLGWIRWDKREIEFHSYLNTLKNLESENKGKSEYWLYIAWVYLRCGMFDELKQIIIDSKIDPTYLKTFLKIDLEKSYKFEGHTDTINSVCFSPDGSYVLSGSDDRTLRLWEIASGKEIMKFEGHIDDVTSVCFSPDGCYVLSGSLDCTIRLWEIASGKEVRTFWRRHKVVYSVCFSPDGSYVLSGSSGKTLYLWDVASGKEIRIKAFDDVFNPVHTDEVKSVCFSPNYSYVLSGSRDRTIRLWEMSSGEESREFIGHTDSINSVCFSPDGRYILSGSSDKTIRLWEIASGKETKKFEGHTKEVCTVCYSSDGRYILSGSWDKTARLWEIASGKEVKKLEGHTKEVCSVCYSPEGRYGLSGGNDKAILLLDLNIIDIWQPYISRISSIKVLGENEIKYNELLIQSQKMIKDKKYVNAYSMLRQAQKIPGYERDDNLLTLIITCGLNSNGQRICLLHSGVRKEFVGHTEWVNSVCFSPDGRYILSGSSDNTLRLWEISSGKETKKFEGHTKGVKSICFSPDGRCVLSGSHDNTIRLWEIASGKETKKFEGHTDRVTSVCFSPDGNYAVSGAGLDDKTLRLWKISSGKETRSL
jgi:WD40 repeat protein